jgi:uncharacterized protein YjbJ (UPF0337 family)
VVRGCRDPDSPQRHRAAAFLLERYSIYRIGKRTAGTYSWFGSNRKQNLQKEIPMNSDQVSGKWKQLKGSVKERWGKLTDDDLGVINGQTEQLVGKIQERYGIARDAAEKQVKEWDSTVQDQDEDVDEQRKAS